MKTEKRKKLRKKKIKEFEKAHPNPMGRPPEYDPKYCQMVIEHMAQGGTFETFAGELRHSKQTLYNWMNVYPEFMDAKKIGESLSLQYYLKIGQGQALGQLRRVISEEVVRDTDGSIVFDKDGNPTFNRKYDYSGGGQASWIFMMKNIHKWRDRTDVNLAGQLPDFDGKPAAPITFDFTNMTRADALARMSELMKKGASPEKK